MHQYQANALLSASQDRVNPEKSVTFPNATTVTYAQILTRVCTKGVCVQCVRIGRKQRRDSELEMASCELRQ